MNGLKENVKRLLEREMRMYILPADADNEDTWQVSVSHGFERIAEAWFAPKVNRLNIWAANEKYKDKVWLALPVNDSISWLPVEIVSKAVEAAMKEKQIQLNGFEWKWMGGEKEAETV